MTRHVLILDDDESFGPRLSTQLKRHDIAAHCPALTIGAITKALRDARIVGIFADVFIEGGGTVGRLLADTHASHPELGLDQIPIWVITGAGEEEDPAGIVREDAPDLHIQKHWFGKPVRVDHLVEIIPVARMVSGVAPPNFDWLPFPVRVLDKKGTVIHVNQHWKGAANRPDPHEFIPFEDAPPQKEFWGSIGDKDHSEPKMRRLVAFRLHSFVHDNHLVQVGQRVAGVPDIGFDTLCEHIAATLADVGFTRCRIYRLIDIPGCNGLGRLVYHNHDLPIPCTDGKLKQFPVPARLSPILAQPLTELPESGLHYIIRTRTEEMAEDDPSLSYWRDHALGHEIESWVEIPVYVAEYAEDGGTLYRTQALLTIDRLGQMENVDGNLEAVERRQIDKITVTLRSMLRDLATSINNERIEARRFLREQVDSLVQRIQVEHHVDKIAIQMMDAAIAISGATGGLLAHTNGPKETLSILGHSGSRPSLRGRRIPDRLTAFPVVRCWHDRKPIFLPDWKSSPEFQQVLAIPDDDLRLFDPDHGHGVKGFFKGIGSLIALPIKSGDRMCGAISLKHPDPWFFTKEKVDALQQLIGQTRWALAAAEEREFRQSWEVTVAHEIKSDAVAIAEALDAMNEALKTDCPASSVAEPQKDLQRRSQHLSDLAISLMTVLGRVVPTADTGVQSPLPVLQKALSYAEDSRRSRRQVIIWRTPEDSGDWRRPLAGEPEMLARVLRVLLENASRHGESEGEIGLSCATGAGEWILTIDNPGTLADAIPDRPTLVSDGTRMRLDMHVGLAASRTWVEQLGGRITLVSSTTCDNRVEATLHWPLARKREGSA